MLQNLSFFDLRETSISLRVLTHAAVLQEIDDNWIEIEIHISGVGKIRSHVKPQPVFSP